MFELAKYDFGYLHTHRINRTRILKPQDLDQNQNVWIDEAENIISFRLRSPRYKRGLSICDIINFCMSVTVRTTKLLPSKHIWRYPKKIMFEIARLSVDIAEFETKTRQRLDKKQ